MNVAITTMARKKNSSHYRSCGRHVQVAIFLALAMSALLSGCGGGSSAPAATVGSFTAAATSVSYGGGTTLSWSVSGATSVSIDNGIGTVSSTGTKDLTGLTATTTYTLTATNSAGATVTATAKVGVGPKITSFSTSTPTITVGDTATLTWVIASGATPSVDNGCTVSSNQCAFKPTATGNYTLTLTATGSDGYKTTATAAVTAIAAPSISSFSAGATVVPLGNTVLLSWQASGAPLTLKTVPATTDMDVTGLSSATVRPAAPSTVYQLTAANSAGKSVTSSTVTVNVFNIATFTTTGYSMIKNQTGPTLSWSVNNGKTRTLLATDTTTNTTTSTDVTGTTSLQVNPPATTSYVLEALDANNDKLDSSPITIDVANSLGAIYSFLASPAASAAVGGTVTLTPVLNSQDAFGNSSYSATITSDYPGDTDVPIKGVDTGIGYPVTLKATTNYTLTVTDTVTGATQSQTLRVVAGAFSAFSGSSVSTQLISCSSSKWLMGTATTSKYCYPYGMARNVSGTMYFADTLAQVIVKLDATGTPTSFAGYRGSVGVGDSTTPTSAMFSKPEYLTFDAFGNMYTVGMECAVRRIDATTSAVTTYAGTATASCSATYGTDGPSTTASFSSLVRGVVVDVAGDVIVAESNSIRAVSSNGSTVKSLAGVCDGYSNCINTSQDGTGTNATFGAITAMAIDSQDNIYIADGAMIRKMTPDKSTGTDATSWTWTTSTWVYSYDSTGVTKNTAGHTDGPASVAQFAVPSAMVIDSDGTLYVIDQTSDYLGGYVRRISADGTVDTLAGTGTAALGTTVGDLPGSFKPNFGLALDSSSRRLYFTARDRAQIYVMPY